MTQQPPPDPDRRFVESSPAEVEQAVEPALADSRQPPPAPRLGIIHILLWMAGSAVLLLFMRRMDERFADLLPEGWQTFQRVMHLVQSMIFGAALTGFPLFYFYWRRRSPYPRHPGHWLLLLLGTGLLLHWVLFETTPVNPQHDYESYKYWAVFRHSLSTAVESLLLVTASVFLIRSRSIIWSLVLLGTVLLSALEWLAVLIEYDFVPGIRRLASPYSSGLPYPLFLYVYRATITLPQLGVMAACLVDVFTRTRRDWAHWMGVCCFLLGAASAWAWQFWSMLNPITP
jgi:hypothetical protein